MSTTVELVRANERYARLRAAVEGLAAEVGGEQCEWGCHEDHAIRLRALLAAVDS